MLHFISDACFNALVHPRRDAAQTTPASSASRPTASASAPETELGLRFALFGLVGLALNHAASLPGSAMPVPVPAPAPAPVHDALPAPAAVSFEAGALHHRFEEHYDDDSQNYYYTDQETGEVTWTCPPEFEEHSAQFHAGWAELKTEEGQTYYEHLPSMQTSWDAPPEYVKARAARAAKAAKAAAASKVAAGNAAAATPTKPAAKVVAATPRWERHTTDDGEFYWENLEDGTTTWDKPSGWKA